MIDTWGDWNSELYIVFVIKIEIVIIEINIHVFLQIKNFLSRSVDARM